jgi:hypothetical protein
MHQGHKFGKIGDFSLQEDEHPLATNATLNNFLEQDIQNMRKESWSRLDKATKLRKLKAYMENEVKENIMTQYEADVLYEYLHSCLDKKRPHISKRIEYNVNTGKVTCIKEASDTKKAETKKIKPKKSARTLKQRTTELNEKNLKETLSITIESSEDGGTTQNANASSCAI